MSVIFGRHLTAQKRPDGLILIPTSGRRAVGLDQIVDFGLRASGFARHPVGSWLLRVGDSEGGSGDIANEWVRAGLVVWRTSSTSQYRDGTVKDGDADWSLKNTSPSRGVTI